MLHYLNPAPLAQYTIIATTHRAHTIQITGTNISWHEYAQNLRLYLAVSETIIIKLFYF